MNKRQFLKVFAGVIAVPAVTLGARTILANEEAGSKIQAKVSLKQDGQVEKIELSKAQWKEKLSAEEYRILRKAGTERPYSSPLNDEKRNGAFACVGCDLPLFESTTKFDSGTGWPSFYAPVDDDKIENRSDRKLIIKRTENVCAGCGAHLGHVFKDRSTPTNARYCMNSASLNFKPAEDE